MSEHIFSTRLLTAIYEDEPDEVIANYLELDGNVNARCSGITIFHALIECREELNPELVKAFLAKGAMVETVDLVSGFTPFDSAIQEKKLDIARILLEHYSDIDFRDDEHGMTPLISVVESDLEEKEKEELILYLIKERNADPTILDSYGRSALSIARKKDQKRILELLSEGVS